MKNFYLEISLGCLVWLVLSVHPPAEVITSPDLLERINSVIHLLGYMASTITGIVVMWKNRDHVKEIAKLLFKLLQN